MSVWVLCVHVTEWVHVHVGVGGGVCRSVYGY